MRVPQAGRSPRTRRARPRDARFQGPEAGPREACKPAGDGERRIARPA